MKLEFEYSVESEIERVKSTLVKREFYLENSYKSLLPEGYSLESDDLSGLASFAREVELSRGADNPYKVDFSAYSQLFEKLDELKPR